ncbi:MAG: ATP-binding cassette domain-containing protein [Candidatus Nanoarchaeia archaeon]|nr:ATP-binding cassette domain-containing protein [Candidatus Nanoarchaeia archaeon]
MEIITVKKIKKSFKKYTREQGLWNAIKSLFQREYKLVEAIRNISFSVEKGEILGYLGPNGAGKSTVIKILTGILYPDSGSIEIMGYVPFDDREKYVQNIGVVMGQKSTLSWSLPAIDSFYLTQAIYQISKKDFEKNLNELTELLEVKEISKTLVRNLSLGERMKCEFINCILHNPKIIFLDEPTIGLDVVAKEKIRNFIKKINKERGTTVILTTHDIDDVEALCHRIILIDKGIHVYEGSLESLKKKFVSYKDLTVEFEKKVKEIKLDNCEVLMHKEFKAKIRVNALKVNPTNVIKKLIDKYPIVDINVDDESVESIIKKIYLSKNDK